MLWWFVAIGAVLAPGFLAAQAPPGTDVYLASLAVRGATITLGSPKNLTRRAGYDNQPGFSADGKQLYYTVVREGGPNGTTQADILRLDLGSGQATSFIGTPESEYSATVTPSGKDVAVIRVEVDSTQRLWAFPLDGGPPRVLLDRIKPVGYQTWLDPTTVGIFVLGSPATLQVADLTTGDAKILLADIGRAVQRVPGRRAISVTHRVAENDWRIVEVDIATGAATTIVAMPPKADYFIWLPDRSLLTAAGATLLRFRPNLDREWQTVATVPGVTTISRLALSPKGDKLAFVAEDQP